MIIVHHLNESRSQRVLWLMEELGLDYEVKRYERNATTRLAPRLLDQRLDKGVELPMCDGIAGTGWSRWSGGGHDFLRSPIELVLLGP